jgi:hypothetical protein
MIGCTAVPGGVRRVDMWLFTFVCYPPFRASPGRDSGGRRNAATGIALSRRTGEFAMKVIAIAALVLVASCFDASAKRWCYVSQDGAQSCGFSSKKQCEAARKGNSVDNCTRR